MASCTCDIHKTSLGIVNVSSKDPSIRSRVSLLIFKAILSKIRADNIVRSNLANSGAVSTVERESLHSSNSLSSYRLKDYCCLFFSFLDHTMFIASLGTDISSSEIISRTIGELDFFSGLFLAEERVLPEVAGVVTSKKLSMTISVLG